MKSKIISLSISCIFFCHLLFAQKKIGLSSPDNNIHFTFSLIKGSAFYTVSYKGKAVIENSSLSLEFLEGRFSENLHLLSPIYREADEKYSLIVGKTKNVNEHFKELLIPIEETGALHRKVNIVVRLLMMDWHSVMNFPILKSSMNSY